MAINRAISRNSIHMTGLRWQTGPCCSPRTKTHDQSYALLRCVNECIQSVDRRLREVPTSCGESPDWRRRSAGSPQLCWRTVTRAARRNNVEARLAVECWLTPKNLTSLMPPGDRAGFLRWRNSLGATPAENAQAGMGQDRCHGRMRWPNLRRACALRRMGSRAHRYCPQAASAAGRRGRRSPCGGASRGVRSGRWGRPKGMHALRLW